MTAPVPMTNCPSDETLAAFIDNRLDSATRRRVIEHMSVCGDCRTVFDAATEFATPSRAEELTPTVVRGRFGRLTLLGGSVAAVLAILIAFGPMRELLRSRSRVDDLVKASASLEYRPLTGRLAGGFPYRPDRPAMRGDEQTESVGKWRVMAAASALEERIGKQRSARDLHAIGVAHAVLGERREAMAALVDALRTETREYDVLRAIRSSKDAELLSDLAAVYLQDASTDEASAIAVEAAEAAWRLEHSPEAAWNRALAIETLHVRERSISAWRDYLALDGESPWANEARARLQHLQSPTDAVRWEDARRTIETAALAGRFSEVAAEVRRFPQASRLWMEDQVLPAWGEAILRDDVRSAEPLAALAAAVGEALASEFANPTIAPTAEAMQRAGTPARSMLASGLAAFGRGRAAYAASRSADAMREFSLAARQLQACGSPFALRAQIEHALAAYQSNDYDRAFEALTTIARTAQLPPALRGRVEWARGLIYLQRGWLAAAADSYKHALAAIQSARERDNEASLNSLLADALQASGDPDQALQYREQALRILDESGDAVRQHAVLFEAAYSAILHDRPAMADLFLDTLAERDTQRKDAVAACTTLMWRSAYRGRRGMTAAAIEDVRNARAICSSIEDPSVRDRALANLALASAILQPRDRADDNVRELTRAAQYYEHTGSRTWLPTLYLERARACRAAGRTEDAERDYRRASAEIERTRESFGDVSSRATFAATADEIDDALVDFLLDEGRAADALDAADTSRARSVRDHDGPAGSMSIAAVRFSLPVTVKIVEYRLLPDRLAMWLVSHDRIDSFADARVGEIAARARSLSSAADAGDDAIMLHDILVRPWLARVSRGDVVVIVADEELDAVPFALLTDRLTRRRLLEDVVLVHAPSAAVFVRRAQLLRQRTSAQERAVVVGDPAFEGERWPHLPRLAAARREAQLVGRLFPNSIVLVDRDATRSRVLASTPGATLLHFAGHTAFLAQERQSVLLLAPGNARDDASLRASDLASARFSTVRLAFLSGCSTDAGRSNRSEGPLTLARSLVAAGVPAVVATTRPVGDELALEMTRAFYAAMRSGQDPARALRAAQLRVMSSSASARDDAGAWGAFRVIGGGVEL